jgi:SAM-dependent methyltransferase
LQLFYDRAAAHYDGWMRPFDRLLLPDGRKQLCMRARGRTLEVAVGTGLNLPYYPPMVTLTGVDLSRAMLAVARRRAEALGRAVELRIGDAHNLDFPDGRFDTVVVTLALCTIPDERRAVAEAHRVLRPGGQLLLLEHVRSPIGPVRAIQRVLEPLFRVSQDSLLRDPMDHLSAVGFRVDHCSRSKWGVIEEVVARKSRLGQEERYTCTACGIGPFMPLALGVKAGRPWMPGSHCADQPDPSKDTSRGTSAQTPGLRPSLNRCSDAASSSPLSQRAASSTS